MIKISARQLECFVALAEDRHFGRAASRVGMAQPPFSKLMSRLEAALGTKLIQRTARPMGLTAAGEAFLPAARSAVDAMVRAENVATRAAAGEVGRIAVGFSASAALTVLPQILQEYRRVHPEAQVELREMTTSAQVAAVASGLLDVGVVRGPIARSDVASHTVMRESFVALFPTAHALGASKAIPLASLAAERMILFPSHVAPEFHATIIRACNAAGFTPTITQEAAEWHTIIGLVSVGLGITIAPASIAALHWSTIVARPLTETSLVAELAVIHNAAVAGPLAQTFLAACRRL